MSEITEKGSYRYIPSSSWKAGRDPNPATCRRDDLLNWYKRETAVLKARLVKDVKRKFHFFIVFIPDDPNSPRKTSKLPKTEEIHCWKLSPQDHAIYQASLDKRFEEKKKIFNARMRQLKEKQNEGSHTNTN